MKFTVYSLKFTLRFQLSVFHDSCLTVDGKRTVNGKWEMVNRDGGICG